MKTVFCKKFNNYDHYNVKRVIELSHVRDCVVNVLWEWDFLIKRTCIRVLGVIDDMSLMVIDENFEIIGLETNNSGVCVSRLLCLEKLYEEEAD